MNEAAIRQRLIELDGIMTALHQGGGPKAGSTDGVYVADTSTEAQSLQQQLEHVRLRLQYVIFDLEATRRENRYLRQMLNSRPPRDQDSSGGGPPEI